MQIEVEDPTNNNTWTIPNSSRISEVLSEATLFGKKYFVFDQAVYFIQGNHYQDTGLKYVRGKFYKEM